MSLLEFTLPPGRLTGTIEVEPASVEDFPGSDCTVFRPNDLRPRLQCLQHRFDLVEFVVWDEVALVQQEHVTELDLVHERLFWNAIPLWVDRVIGECLPGVEPLPEACARRRR